MLLFLTKKYQESDIIEFGNKILFFETCVLNASLKNVKGLFIEHT